MLGFHLEIFMSTRYNVTTMLNPFIKVYNLHFSGSHFHTTRCTSPCQEPKMESSCYSCGKQPKRRIFINNSWTFQGQNGILELSIRGHEDIFEVRINQIKCLDRLDSVSFYCQISPPVVQQFGQFVISVKNNKKIDAEKIKKFQFQVWQHPVKAEFLLLNLLSLQIIATETGPGRQSTSADVIVNVLDTNDNPPVFSKQEYRSISNTATSLF